MTLRWIARYCAIAHPLLLAGARPYPTLASYRAPAPHLAIVFRMATSVQLVLFARQTVLGLAGNGVICSSKVFQNQIPPNSTFVLGCTSPLAGEKPFLCSDKRFSCPRGFECDLLNSSCSVPGTAAKSQQPLLRNVPSKRLKSEYTYNSTDVCSIIDGINLPSECSCQPEPNAGLVTCSVDVLNQIELGAVFFFAWVLFSNSVTFGLTLY